MMDKDISRVKLPRIRPPLRQTVSLSYSEEKRFSNVNFDVPSSKHITKGSMKAFHEKSTYWKSAQSSWGIDDKGASGGYNRRVRTLETSSKASDQTYHDASTTFALPLRRHNSEPFLQQNFTPSTVKATSLKLNHRKKERMNNNDNKKLFTDLLPSVFFDTRTANSNQSKEEEVDKELGKKMTKKTAEKNRKNNFKENSNRVSKEPTETKTDRQKTSGIDQVADKVSRKPLKVLPKRRLSEQIDSYEINRNNSNVYPRRITIRTSKSCPTIVIHECGENDQTSDDGYLVDNGKDSKEISSEQLNGRKDLNENTTSFVSCWRPKHSIVNGK